MVAQIEQHGQDFYLKLDPAMLKRMRIDADTPLDVKEVDDALLIRPASHRIPDEVFRRALEKVNQDWGDVLQRLAE